LALPIVLEVTVEVAAEQEWEEAKRSHDQLITVHRNNKEI
jgi:hypothetical protein